MKGHTASPALFDLIVKFSEMRLPEPVLGKFPSVVLAQLLADGHNKPETQLAMFEVLVDTALGNPRERLRKLERRGTFDDYRYVTITKGQTDGASFVFAYQVYSGSRTEYEISDYKFKIHCVYDSIASRSPKPVGTAVTESHSHNRLHTPGGHRGVVWPQNRQTYFDPFKVDTSRIDVMESITVMCREIERHRPRFDLWIKEKATK